MSPPCEQPRTESAQASVSTLQNWNEFCWQTIVHPTLIYFRDIVLCTASIFKHIIILLKYPFALFAFIIIGIQALRLGGRFTLQFIGDRVPSLQPCNIPLAYYIINCPDRPIAPVSSYPRLLEYQVEKFNDVYDKGIVSKNVAREMYMAAVRDIPTLKSTLHTSSLTSKEAIIHGLDRYGNQLELASRHLQIFHATITQEIFTLIARHNAHLKRMQETAPASMVDSIDIYKKALDQFEKVIEHITISCVSATEKLDELGGISNSINDLARDELDLELTDIKHVGQAYWTKFGGNRKLISKLTRNIEHLNNTVTFVKVAKQTLLDAAYILKGMKTSVATIQGKIAYALIEDSDDAFETEVQYQAVVLGIMGLVNVHNRGVNEELHNNAVVYQLS